MGNGAIYLAAALFALGALIHLARLFCPFEVIIGWVHLPREASYISFLISGLLAAALLRARHHQPERELPRR